MTNVEFICLQAASAAFLTENLPSGWNELEQHEQDEWLLDHGIAAYEDLDSDSLFALIDDHATSIRGAINESLKLVKAKMIDAALIDKFPLDLNELHMSRLLDDENYLN